MTHYDEPLNHPTSDTKILYYAALYNANNTPIVGKTFTAHKS